MTSEAGAPTPGMVCRALLDALGASDGRRRKRKRDTTADAIGMALKRELLERAAREAPDGDQFEAWLLEQCTVMSAGGETPAGAVRAMAQDIFAEWLFAVASPSFQDWLAHGAPSADGEDAATGS